MTEDELNSLHDELVVKINNFCHAWKNARGCPDTDTVPCECAVAPARACERMYADLDELMHVSAPACGNLIYGTESCENKVY